MFLKNRQSGLVKSRRIPGDIYNTLLVFIASIAFNNAISQQDTSSGKDEETTHQPAKGILPQLGNLLQVPEDFILYDPETPKPPEEPIEYKRTFPIMGEAVINQGYRLPLPIGISVIGVDNTQGQNITDVNVALGKGVFHLKASR